MNITDLYAHSLEWHLGIGAFRQGLENRLREVRPVALETQRGLW